MDLLSSVDQRYRICSCRVRCSFLNDPRKLTIAIAADVPSGWPECDGADPTRRRTSTRLVQFRPPHRPAQQKRRRRRHAAPKPCRQTAPCRFHGEAKVDYSTICRFVSDVQIPQRRLGTARKSYEGDLNDKLRACVTRYAQRTRRSGRMQRKKWKAAAAHRLATPLVYLRHGQSDFSRAVSSVAKRVHA
jgi:hypothetical protein